MGLRVLLADDSPVVRRAVRALLEREGMAVPWEAAAGDEAVTVCRRHHPDVAILDFRCMAPGGRSRLRGQGAGPRRLDPRDPRGWHKAGYTCSPASTTPVQRPQRRRAYHESSARRDPPRPTTPAANMTRQRYHRSRIR